MLPETIHTIGLRSIEERWADRKLKGLFVVTDEDYHGGPGLSSTGVKKLLRSPAHFAQETPDSDALRFGRMVHEALFQPELFARRYAYEPPISGPRNRNPWKQEWDAFKERCATHGLEIVAPADSVTLQGILKALGENRTWNNLTTGARYEIAAYAQRNVGDMAVLTKAKADILLTDGETIYIPDLKTCQDARPEAFTRSIMDYGYHISAAWYVDTFAEALGIPPEQFQFIFVAVEKPAPHGVSFYPASPDMMRIGRIEGAKAIGTYADCSKSGKWPGYPETFTQLELPSWYTRRFQ